MLVQVVGFCRKSRLLHLHAVSEQAVGCAVCGVVKNQQPHHSSRPASSAVGAPAEQQNVFRGMLIANAVPAVSGGLATLMGAEMSVADVFSLQHTSREDNRR